MAPPGVTDHAREAELWFMLAFIPLLPLARWRVTMPSASSPEATGQGIEIRVVEELRLVPAFALRRVLAGVAGATAVCLPLAFAVSRVGDPWAGAPMSTVVGSLLPSSLLDKAAMAVELGMLVLGAMLPILVIGWLDARIVRIPVAEFWAGRTRR